MDILEVTEKSLVVKSNAIVEARYKLDIREQKLVLFLISNIKKEDDDLKEYAISVRDMAQLLGLSDWEIPGGRFYEQMKQIAKNIVSEPLEIPKEGKGYLIATWFSSVEYVEEQGLFKIKFDSKLKPYLFYIKSHYTKYLVRNVSKLKSTYSIRIYELLKQYEKIGKRLFSIDDLKAVLKIDKKEYAKIDHFHTKVIKPAYKELPQKTDIRFEYEFIKTGRKYTDIMFYIYAQGVKEELPAMPEDQIELAFDEVGATLTEEVIKPDLLAKIMRFGISEPQARAYMKSYDEAYILDNLAIVEENAKSQTIDNLGAYTAKALKMDYRKQTNAFEETKKRENEEKARIKAEREAELRRRQEKGAELQKEFERLHTAKVKEFIALVHSNSELKKAYDDWFAGDSSKPVKMVYNLMIKKPDQDEEKVKYMLYSAYYTYVQEQTSEKEDSFEAYAQKQGYTIQQAADGNWLAWQEKREG